MTIKFLIIAISIIAGIYAGIKFKKITIGTKHKAMLLGMIWILLFGVSVILNISIEIIGLDYYYLDEVVVSFLISYFRTNEKLLNTEL